MLWTKFVIVAISAMLLCGQASAGDMTFPRTSEEFVSALKFKDGAIKHRGLQYKVQDGRIYKVIKGKRYRIRGLAGIDRIEESPIVPKAGALVTFSSNSDNIKPQSLRLLDEFAKALKGELSGAKVVVAGHTDEQGADQYNLNLSQKRSQAVMNYLVQNYGIDAKRLVVKAYGERKPIATNGSEQGRRLNRRVEFIRVE